ncbi:separase [Cryptosporidium andersoni]|uniref:separase n=1 Tax=Cryptosporidium andersoni TaxID=117008 RepID=A0A1J4MSU0_9CRYT|nr:separase [Cryptosporidium andersoni]
MLKQWSSQIKFEYEARRFNNAITLGINVISTIIEDILNLPSNKRQSPDDFNLNIDILFCKLFELGLTKSYASNIRLFLKHFGIFLYHSDGKLYNYKKCNLYLIRNISFLPDIFGYFTISIIELKRIEFLRHYCNLVQMIFPLFVLSDLINNKSQWNTEKVLVSSIIRLCQSISSKNYLGTDIDKSQDYLNICSDLWQICLNIWIQYFGARIQYTNISQIKNSHMNDLDTQVCVINLFIDMLKHLRDLICIISKSNLEIGWQIEIVYKTWIHIFYNQYILFQLEDEFNWSKTYMQELLEQTLESPFLSNTAQAIYNIILHLIKGFSKLNDKHINFDLVIQFISQFNSLINLMVGITHKYIKHFNKSIDMEDELFLFNRKDMLELRNSKYFKYFSCFPSIKLRFSNLEEIHCFKLWLCLSSSLLLNKFTGKIKELNMENFSKLGSLYESMVYLIIGVLSSSNLNYEDIYTLVILNYLVSSQQNYFDSGLLKLNSKESCLNFCRNFNALRINCIESIIKPVLKKSESVQDIHDKLKLKWEITFKLVCILEKSISLIESCGDFIINSYNSSNIKIGELATDINSITRSEEDKENDNSLNLLSNNILNTSFKARLCATEILIRLIRYRGYDNEEIRKIYEFLDGVSKYRYFQKIEDQYLADELRFNFFLVLSENLIRLASQLRSSKNYKDASRIARLALDTLTPILNIPWISSENKILRVNKSSKIGSLDFDPTLEVQSGELINTPTRDSNLLKLQLTAGFKDEYLTQETFSRFWISGEGKSSINRSSMHEYFNGTRATNQTLMTPFTSRLYSKGLSTVRSQTIKKIQKYTMSSFRFKKNQGYDITLDEYKEDEEASSFICPIHVLLFLLALEQESSALAAYCDSELKNENNRDEKLQKYFEILTNIEDYLSLILHSVDDYTRWFLIYFIICNKILGIDKLVKKFYLETDDLKFNLNYTLMDSISNPFIGVLKSLASRYIKSKLEILQLNSEYYSDIINRFPQFNLFNFFEFIWIRLELYFYSYYRHSSTIVLADDNKEDNSKAFINHKYSDVYIKGINNGFCSGLISLYNVILDKFKPNSEDILDSFIYCDMKLCLYYFLIWIHRIIISRKIKKNILLPFDSCLEVAMGILNKIESHLLDVFEARECEEIVKSQLYLYLGKINMLKAKTMMESTSSISDFWWKSSLNSSRQSCEYISVSFDLLNSFNILCTKTESIMNSEGLISMNTSVWKEHFLTGNENFELASNSYEYDSLGMNNLGIPKPLCSMTADQQGEKGQNEKFFTPKRLTASRNRDTAISFKTPGRVRFEEASGDKSKSIMGSNMQLARTHSVVRFQIDSPESDNEDNIRKDEKSFIEQSSIFNNAITFEMLGIYLHCILESISLCELLNYQQGVIKHLSLVLSLLSSCWIFCIEDIKYDESKSIEKIANIIDFNTKSFVENNLMRNFSIQSYSNFILPMQFEIASVISICLYRFTALTTDTSYNNNWKQICAIFHKGFLYFLQNHPSLSTSFGNQQGIYSSHTFCFEILLQLQLYRLEICNDLDWNNIVDCLNSIKEMFADIHNKKTTANTDFFKELTEDSLYKKSLYFSNDSSSNILQDSVGPFRFNTENRLNCLVTLCRVYKKLSKYFLTSNKPDIALFYILEANKIIQMLPKKSIPFLDLAKSNKLIMESTNYLYKIKFPSYHNILGKLIMEDYSNSFVNSKNLAIEQLCTLGEYWWKCGVIERCFGIYERALDICIEWTNSYYKAVNIVYNQLSFLLTSSIGRCNPQYNLYYSVNKLIEEKNKSTYSKEMVDKQLEGDICSENNIIEPRSNLFDEADEDIYRTTDENNKSLKNINNILNLVFSPISDLIKNKHKNKIMTSKTESLHLNNIFQKLLNILVYCLLYFHISRNNTDEDTKIFFDSIKKYSKIIFEILGKLEQENSWLYLFQKQCIQKLSSRSTKPTSKYKYQHLLDMITSNFSMLDNNINFISDIAICFVLDLSHNCIQLALSLKNTTLKSEKDEDTILFLACNSENFSNINEYFDADFKDLILSELDKVWSIIGFFSKDDQIKDNVLSTKNRKSKQKKLIKEKILIEKNEENSSSTKYNIYNKSVDANDKNHGLINCNIKANIINSLHFTTFTLQLCHKIKNFQYINICISCILDILLCLYWLTRYYHIPKVLETIRILTPLSCSVQSCYIVYCMRIFQKLFNQLQRENFEEGSSFDVEYRNTLNCLLKSSTLSSWNFSKTIFDLNDINLAWSNIFIRLSTFTCRFRCNKMDSRISNYSLKSNIGKQNPNEYVIVQISRLLIGNSLFSDKYITNLLEFRNQEIKTKNTNEYSRYPSLNKSSEAPDNSTFTKPLFIVVRRIHYKTLESLLEEYEQIQKENLASIVTNQPIDNNQLSKECLPNYSHKLYVNKWWLKRRNIQDQLKIWLAKFEAFIFNKWNFLLHGWPKYFNYENLVDTINNQYIISQKESLLINSKSSEVRKSNRRNAKNTSNILNTTDLTIYNINDEEKTLIEISILILITKSCNLGIDIIKMLLRYFSIKDQIKTFLLSKLPLIIQKISNSKLDQDNKKSNKITKNDDVSNSLLIKQLPNPIILYLDPLFMNLPLEGLECNIVQPITRGVHPSISLSNLRHFKSKLKHENSPYAVFSCKQCNLFYCINPTGDLIQTENLIVPYLKSIFRFSNHSGISNFIPNPKDVLTNMSNKKSNLYLFCGHQAGEKFLPGEALEKGIPSTGENFNFTNAKSNQIQVYNLPPALLIGCSSSRMRSYGSNECFCTPFHYLIGGSPFVLGILWDVTDHDIDLFTVSIFEIWSDYKNEHSLSLLDAITISRNKCKLQLLNGNSCICFGFPV